ncbi:hypothetical protein Pan258_25650 [Symmachiella dynata]|uniref:hypothetical protein n=1 Tax=Symmachiella dynata TaxID=2527995 RepID=UPI00118C780F|nr:hypothetical protein [Symmachiella dynata]QDT48523.1 hypothetical protein Pan258_25650 [Symmachiella dynata]
MARMLALDWTRNEARYVLANSSGEKLTIEASGAISLSELADADFASAEKFGEAIRTGLSSAKVGRATTLLGMSREQVELLNFSVPAVPPAELPEIVLNLAMRESPTVTEESVVDFVSSTDGGDDTAKVTAAAVTAEKFRWIQQACSTAKLSPQKIVLRPYATAALLPAGNSQRSLLVNRVGEDVDLTVVDAGHVVFSRSVRVPAQDNNEATTSRLMQEIRRTMMVAPHGSGNRGVEAVYLLGREEEHAELLAVIRREFASDRPGGADDHTSDVDVSAFDVFASLGVDHEAIPKNSGSYAALLGMLRTEADGGTHPFDFLNPRKPPKPPDRKRIMMLVGGLALVAAVVFAYPLYEEYQDNQATIDGLMSEIKEAKASEKTIKKQAAIAATLSKWESGGVNWLNELQTFSTRFPPPRDAMVLRMALSSSRGGIITFNGLARDPAVVTRMELDLRDDTHDIQTPRVQERVQENGYTWQFETKVSMTPPKAASKESEKSAEKSSGKKEKTKSDGKKSPAADKKPTSKSKTAKKTAPAKKTPSEKTEDETTQSSKKPAEDSKDKPSTAKQPAEKGGAK